jgi:hypothetical protein
MKHWELEHSGELIRIEWNEVATFNLQTPIGGRWVDYHCFTCYGIETDQEALEHAFEVLLALEIDPLRRLFEVPEPTEPTETRTEYCARMGHDM